MGTSRSAAELAGKVNSAARAIPRANREATSEAALEAKGVFIAGIRKAGGTPGSKWEGTRGRTGAGYDVKGDVNATAIVAMRGPVHLLFFGAPPHFIGARLLGTRGALRKKSRRIGATAAFGGSNRGVFAGAWENAYKRASARNGIGKWGDGTRTHARALKTPQGLRAYAFHPGTKGDNQWPWTKSTAAKRGSARWVRAHRQFLLKQFR